LNKPTNKLKQIETEILIDANPKRVWQVLTDFDNHPKWNPFIKSISGEKEVGKKLTVKIQPPEGKGMTFNPRVLSFAKNEELRWIGKLFVKGIFDGEHYFKLIENGKKQTKFVHGEKFSGILVPLMTKVLENTKQGFKLMNEALKSECEKK